MPSPDSQLPVHSRWRHYYEGASFRSRFEQQFTFIVPRTGFFAGTVIAGLFELAHTTRNERKILYTIFGIISFIIVWMLVIFMPTAEHMITVSWRFLLELCSSSAALLAYVAEPIYVLSRRVAIGIYIKLKTFIMQAYALAMDLMACCRQDRPIEAGWTNQSPEETV